MVSICVATIAVHGEGGSFINGVHGVNFDVVAESPDMPGYSRLTWQYKGRKIVWHHALAPDFLAYSCSCRKADDGPRERGYA